MGEHRDNIERRILLPPHLHVHVRHGLEVDGKGEGKGSSVRIFAKNRGERPGFEGLAQGTTVRIDGPRGG